MTNKTSKEVFKSQMGLRGNKYFLNYNKTHPYFIEHIDSGKCTLYSKIKETIDFKKGNFFTFLTEKTQTETLYEFERGIIRPNPPEKESDQEDFDIDDLSYEFIFNFLNKDPTKTMILDQFIVEWKDLHFKGVEVVSYIEEVYYLLNSKTPIDSIFHSIKRTDQWWHCLGVLTEGLEQPSVSLNEEDLDLICKNLKYIMTTAYDGEGYLFWERKCEV